MLGHQILFSMRSSSYRRVTVLCLFFSFFFQKILNPEICFHRLLRFFLLEKYVLQSHHYVLLWIPLLTSENLWLKSQACMPLFGKWVCAHWGTNSRKRRELILLTTYAKIVGFGAARDVKPIRPLVKFFRKYLTIFSSTFSLVLLRSMPLSWVTLVSFAVVLLVARIIYDISEKSRKLQSSWTN